MVALRRSRSASARCLSISDCRLARSFSSSSFCFPGSNVSCCSLVSVPLSKPAELPDFFPDVFVLGISVPPPDLYVEIVHHNSNIFSGTLVFHPRLSLVWFWQGSRMVYSMVTNGPDPLNFYYGSRIPVMSARHSSSQSKDKVKAAVKAGPSMDRERHLEDAQHHPMDHPLPHPKHKSIPKPTLPPKHTPHVHSHGDELPPHTNKPGPVKPSKKMTKTGKK